jgi:probable HAF family extracellular repeat protein
LLTGGSGGNAKGVTLNSDGTVQLTGSGIKVEAGDVVAQQVTAQTATLAGTHNLTLVESQLHTTGDMNLLAANTVRVRDSAEQPFSAIAGGNLYIQGNRGIDILALNHLDKGTPFQSGGAMTFVSDGNISGDSHFASGGRFSMFNLSGGAGTFISLYDPIISSNSDVTLGNYTGASLKVETRGTITAGNITITTPDTTLTGTDLDIPILTSSPALILRAGLSELQNPVSAPIVNAGGTTIQTVGYSVINLGTLPGGSSSEATGINNSGQVVGSSDSSSGTRAFLYSGGTMSNLGTLPGINNSYATGINNSGQVVGNSFPGASHAFLYSGGTIIALGMLPGGFYSYATGINNSGQVVGYSVDRINNNGRAFLYSGGTMIALPIPDINNSGAIGINNSGQVVGYSDSSSGNRAFLYSGGTITDLGVLPGDISSIATGINDSGQVVGYSNRSSIGDPRAFLYSGGTMIDLGTLPGGITTNPYDINNSGQVVGEWTYSSNGFRAFLYSGGTMTDLNNLIPSASGWTLTTARAINDSGQIAGTSSIGGQNRAFRADPIVTPTGGITVGNISTAGGPVIFQGPIINLTGSSIRSNGGYIRFEGPVVLNNNIQTNSAGGNITFLNTLNSAPNTQYSAQLSAGTGDINFNSAVGGITPVGNLSIANAQNVTAASTIAAASLQQSAGTGTTNLLGDVTTTDLAGVNITISNNITTRNITTQGQIIHLSSQVGAVLASNLDSSGAAGDGGAIALIAATNIQTGEINSSGIRNGGAITVNAGGKITTDSIYSAGNLSGGQISLTSNSDITTARLVSFSHGTGGDIILQGAGNITTDKILSSSDNWNAGRINLTSGGNITTNVLSSLANGTGGNINLLAAGNITTDNIVSSGGNGNGGKIDLTSGGSINIPTESGISSGSLNGNGGDITFNAANSITTRSLLFSSSAIANGGNIALNAANGDIELLGIQAEGGAAGTGGTVDITTSRFFRATDSFQNLNGTTASISTSGAIAGGAIVIRHGGAGVTPFKVGDAGTNGTAAAITTGNLLPVQTISPQASFLYTHSQGGMQILSVSEPPAPPPPTPLGSIRSSDTSPQDALAFLAGDIVGARTSVNQDPLSGNSSYVWQIPGLESLDTGRIRLQNNLPQITLNDTISQIDEVFQQEFEDYLGEKLPHEKVTVEGIRNVLKSINTETGTHPVVIYALTMPEQLELVMVMPEGPPIRKVIPQANATILKQTLTKFRGTVIDVGNSRGYVAPAQQLYQWMIAPLEPQLKALGIDTLIFCMDAGLRQIPMAALHDGKQFLVEKYSIGSIPSISLTNSRYKAVKDTQVLGMGASKFQELQPLPAVPTELEVITKQLWSGDSFLNEDFTLDKLKAQRQRKPFGIIHLATHADFQAGNPNNSYIQLWDTQLRLDQLRQMGWSEPPQVELLVLSACRTAVGDVKAELGFAGLAVQAGVKSALASLWYVSDEGTLALMSEFYQHLSQPDVTIKAEALRRSQIAMLRGQVRLENGKLRGLNKLGEISLPPELAARGNHDLSHPFYWAGFTMIGSPW